MSVPEDAARLIQDVLAEVGWNANAEDIAERVRRLDLGLPAEDEFAVVCAWLGKCELIHKLDQQQVPVGSRDNLQVPDLLAKFSSATSPVLIEVKSSKKKVLSLQPVYLERLQRYADLLGLPLLIAWKWFGIWILFEPQHLRKATRNFNISWGDALMQSLMGVLAGDVSFNAGEGAGLHLSFRKEELIGEHVQEGTATQEWKMVVDDVFFTGYDGLRKDKLPMAVQSLLMMCDLSEEEIHSDSHIKKSFVVGPHGSDFAHRALVNLLNWEARDDERLSWRALLRAERITAHIDDLQRTLAIAMDEKIIHHVIHVRPHQMPVYVIPEVPDELA